MPLGVCAVQWACGDVNWERMNGGEDCEPQRDTEVGTQNE
jgi:hypothetical protein